jgi:DNA mismatch repair protein MutS
MSVRLRVDARTLSDLEVLPDGAGGYGLLSLLDRTRTPGGKRALREILQSPWADVDSIRSAQDTLRFLRANLAWCGEVVEAEGVAGVERYLASRYACLDRLDGPWSTIGARWTALRYPTLLAEAARGVDDVGRLAEETLVWCDRLAGSGPPAALAEAGDRLRGAVGELLAVVAPARARGTAPAVLRADARLRGPLRPAVERWLAALYRWDALVGLARASDDLGWVFPEIVEGVHGVQASVSALRHPLLVGSVANDVRFEAGLPLLFLTGPNMAGKTTLMRAVGLAVYLAQLGMAVPAGGMRLAPFSTLISGIGVVDSVQAGCSHFLSEVRRLREGAEALATGERVLLLFDELLHGTNQRDALEAASAVIEAFARCPHGATIVSSHAAELLPQLERTPGVALLHFDMSVADGVPQYSYRLQPGAYSERMAMVLLREEGLLSALERLPKTGTRRGPEARP